MDGAPYKIDYGTGEFVCGTCGRHFPAAYRYKTQTPRVMSTRNGIAGPAAANFYKHIDACSKKAAMALSIPESET